MPPRQADSRPPETARPIVSWTLLLRRWAIVYALFQPAVLLFFLWRYRGSAQMPNRNGLVPLALDTAINDLAWAVVLLPALALLLRYRPERNRIRSSVVVPLLSAPVFVYLHVPIYLGMYMAAGAFIEGAPDIRNPGDFWAWLLRLNPLWRALHFGALLLIHYCCEFYALYAEKERRAAELQSELATARLHALQVQLQPHFLFNTLHAIHVLVRQDPEKSCKMIEHLSRLLRLTLQRSDLPEVSLRDELDALEPYLSIEKTRFGDRLTVRQEVAPEALNAAVPNLVLQPLVENAVKHGISGIPGPGYIAIRAARSEGNLVLEVSDNGAGCSGNGNSRGIGLSNLRKRLECLYGSDQRFTLTNLEPEGCGVRIEIPFREAGPANGDRWHDSKSVPDHGADSGR